MAEIFKPGKYTAGTEVIDIYGTTFRVNRDIFAVSPPSHGYYYTYVKSGPPPITGGGGGEVYAININDEGVKPDNTPEQNSAAIEAFLNSLTIGIGYSVYAPHGDYKFAMGIVIDSRPINFFGDNGSPWALGTKFYFPAGETGIVINRSHGYQGTILQNIAVIGNPNSTTWASGITCRARTTIIGCSAKGFSHNGIDFWANIEGEGTDASGSLVQNCVAVENVHDGYFAGRTDANAITFIGNDARDNLRYGFNDDSFLGNTYISNMAHNNKAGHYYVRDKGNARTNIFGAYCEGGSPASDLSPRTTVIGGIWECGFDLQDGKGVQYK